VGYIFQIDSQFVYLLVTALLRARHLPHDCFEKAHVDLLHLQTLG